LLYLIEGELSIGNQNKPLSKNNLGILERGEKVSVTTKTQQSRFLLISAKPLNETIARGGPFVMNTEAL